MRIKKNLAAVLPLAISLAIWICLIDCLHVFVVSSALIESMGKMILVLTYAWILSLVVTVFLISLLSIIVSLLDWYGRLDPVEHSSRVAGAVLFFAVIATGLFILIGKGDYLRLLDPRKGIPFVVIILAGWVLARIIGIYIRHRYDPIRWPAALGSQLSYAAGLTVFTFGSIHWIYSYYNEVVIKIGGIPLSYETALIYLSCLIFGCLAWFIMKFASRKAGEKGPIGIAGLFIILTLLSLVLFLRPLPQSNPGMYKHNPDGGNNGRNVILISVDTLRYDRLGCNGNEYIDTPNIDALAAESAIFNNCITHMPITVPSHASMLTGLTPRSNGVISQVMALDPDFETIAEQLSGNGFTCGGIISMGFLNGSNSNLDQGFHYYDDLWVAGEGKRYFPAGVKYLISRKIIRMMIYGAAVEPSEFGRRAEVSIDSALKWLEYVKDEDFFCFLHLFDPHWEYNAPEPYKTMYDPDYKGDMKYQWNLLRDITAHKVELDRDDLDHIIARYDGEVTYADVQLGRLFKRLNELGIWDETMIILTADHGEGLEHDYYFGHGLRVYQSSIQVPLIIKPVGGANGRKVDALCSVADIFPTICDLLNIEPDVETDGVSLAPFATGEGNGDYVPHDFLFSETYPYGTGPDNRGRIYSVICGDYKLIYNPTGMPYVPTYQLFDISVDPGETINLISREGKIFSDLSVLLRDWAEESEWFKRRFIEQPKREMLEALQYLQ